MTVDQTILASDPKRPGNCLAACVATFLGIDLEAVPHFVEHEGYACIDCGYSPLEDDYEPEDVNLLDPHDLSVLAELGPAGREALG